MSMIIKDCSSSVGNSDGGCGQGGTIIWEWWMKVVS